MQKVPVEEFRLRKIQLKENEKDTKEEKAEDDEEMIQTLIVELNKLQISAETKL